METATPTPILETVRDATGLRLRVAEWDDLARHALEPNVFYESTWILALLRHFGPMAGLLCLFVYLPDPSDPAARRLIGFFPFRPSVPRLGRLVRTYRLFNHLLCYLGTPLVHRDHAAAALDGLLDWIDGAPDGVRLFALYHLRGDGPLGHAFAERFAARRQPHWIEHRVARAEFHRAESAEAYLARALPGRKRKELRRQRRRLADHGPVTLTTRTDDPDGSWARDFLALEAGTGWKARSGKALASLRAGPAFLDDVLAALGRGGRVVLHSLAVGGRPVAMKCNLIAAGGEGAFAFKIAHDSAYAAQSPGVLLELDNIADLHARPGAPAWMDSCADPDHSMIDRLWPDRRIIVYTLCASRGLRGRVLMALVRLRPWLAGLKHRFRGTP